jgi:ketosteroid isomerase-like protein
MKYLKLLAVISLPLHIYSQGNIDGLVKAERNFSAYAVLHGIKPAFLQFADSTGVLFDKGKAVNAIQLWNARENRPGILKWYPTYVEIAASHDFGFTTGPWTFQPNSIEDSIVARGRFITVWHTTQTGEWKFLVDLGISNAPVSMDTILQKMEITDPLVKAGTIADLKEAENNFIVARKQSIKNAYLQFTSNQVILNRNGLPPARSASEIQNLLDNFSQPIEFTIDSYGIASSGDLGYVYGNTLVNGKMDNFLHVWRKEKDGWRLALEVLRF